MNSLGTIKCPECDKDLQVVVNTRLFLQKGEMPIEDNKSSRRMVKISTYRFAVIVAALLGIWIGITIATWISAS